MANPKQADTGRPRHAGKKMIDEMTGLARHLTDWKPEPATARDTITPLPAKALAAVLDVPDTAPRPGRPLPPLWHWLYFHDAPAQRDLGADGHPAHGRFLPPLPERTRMFAGGRLRIEAPLIVGAPAERHSRLADVTVKQGRTGELAFVTVRHEIHQDGELKLVDEQDLVYRSGPRPPVLPAPAPGPARSGPRVEPTTQWQLALTADPVMLFRFSALTANSHRIHYDAPYARDVEGYPGLVVHGPLLVLSMLEPLRREGRTEGITAVTYRLRRPVFAGDPVVVTGEPEGAGTSRFSVLTSAAETPVAAHAEVFHA